MLACHAGGPGSIRGRCNCFENKLTHKKNSFFIKSNFFRVTEADISDNANLTAVIGVNGELEIMIQEKGGSLSNDER